jgi:hypothetical protein
LILDYNFENTIENIDIEGLLEIFITNISTKFDIIIVLYISDIIIVISILTSVIEILGGMVIFSAKGGTALIAIFLIRNII